MKNRNSRNNWLIELVSNIHPAILLLMVLALVSFVGALIGLVFAIPAIVGLLGDCFHAIQIPLLSLIAFGLIASIIVSIHFHLKCNEKSFEAWGSVAVMLFLLGYLVTRL